MKTLSFIPGFFFITFILFLSACSSQFEDPDTFHSPTPLAIGEAPIQAICRIQQEFHRLSKPVLKDIRFHKKSSEVEFAFYRMPRDAYYQYELTSEAREFLRRHSRAELIFSLPLLITNPEWGGEVAVILMGLPPKNRKEAHKKWARPTTFLYETGYRNPDQTGHWDEETAIEFTLRLQPVNGRRPLYWLRNMYWDPQETNNFANTLEDKLAQFWAEYLTLQKTAPNTHRGFLPSPEPVNTSELQELLDINPAPGLGPTLQTRSSLPWMYGVLTCMIIGPWFIMGSTANGLRPARAT
jgi:hypothetical protein